MHDIRLQRTIAASRRAVFEAWLDPVALSEFIRPAEGMEAPEVKADGREGGDFLINMKVGDEIWPHRGTYRKLDPYRELQFSWLSGHTTEDSLVTIRLTEISPGETDLELIHTGFPSDKARDDHQGGWTRIVEVLDSFLQ